MGLTLKGKQPAVIRWCERRQLWAVHCGLVIPYFGTLYACELFCQQNNIMIRNQAEIDRIKYNNMPTWEGLA